jgi:undecaprenyl pyrophosphate synthase
MNSQILKSSTKPVLENKDLQKIPKSIGVILDGNRRWARKREIVREISVRFRRSEAEAVNLFQNVFERSNISPQE